MDFLKKLFGSRKKKKLSTLPPPVTGLTRDEWNSAETLRKKLDEQRARRNEVLEEAKAAFDFQSVDGLVKIIADAPPEHMYDRQNPTAFTRGQRASRAIEVLQKKTDLDNNTFAKNEGV